jgi:hypothetical protein
MKPPVEQLRELEDEITAEFPDHPGLAELSELIMRLEVGDLFWVVGPNGKTYRCEKAEKL